MQVRKDTLLKRINRALRPRGAAVRAARGERARITLGDYYLVAVEGGAVLRRYLELEAFGRELGVLGTEEALDTETPHREAPCVSLSPERPADSAHVVEGRKGGIAVTPSTKRYNYGQ